MDILQYILIIVTLIAGIGVGSERFGFIKNENLRIVVFIIFVISIIGDAIVAGWKLILKKRNEYYQDRKIADELITKALDLANLTMHQVSSCEFRSCVFLKCPRDKKKICITFCSSNMKGAKDLDLRFEKWQGCSGKAWGYKAPTVADLTLPEIAGGAGWGLSPEQVEKTKNLGAILSVPIHHTEKKEVLVGILSLDTKEPAADFLAKEQTKDTAIQFASQIELLLYASNQIRELE